MNRRHERRILDEFIRVAEEREDVSAQEVRQIRRKIRRPGPRRAVLDKIGELAVAENLSPPPPASETPPDSQDRGFLDDFDFEQLFENLRRWFDLFRELLGWFSA